MKNESIAKKAILMIAYTNYKTDPRVIRAAEAAVEGGFEVEFLALRRNNDPNQEILNGVKLIHLNQERYRGGGISAYILAYLQFFIRCFVKTSVLHLQRRYRVIHVNNMPDFFVFCAIVPKLMGAKVLLDIHDPMPNTFASKFKSGETGFLFKLLLWQEKLSAFFADAVLTVHDPVKDYILVKQHGIAADDIKVIANFADDQLFKLQNASPFDGKLKLVFHGSILERYGLKNALIALTKIKHRESISVKIIGEGDYSLKLKELITLNKLESRVDFDNQMYPLSEIPSMLRGYHFGLVPLHLSSITEYALPLKLLEYLSLGIPSITVKNSAISYYFGNDDCLFYQPDEPESLAVILDRLIENPELISAYQQRAIKLREKFLWSKEKAKYQALLQALSA
jgi:glycosyltransferase involved in cell wall biosynthesis